MGFVHAPGPMAGTKLTPMMAQYQTIRRSLPDDVLLFFRLGDFYELFFEDAKDAAPILNVALTRRNGIPMCGVPYHAADGYIAKLVKASRRVAIAEQTTEPVQGKIVEREVTRIISAGSVIEHQLLEDNRANYLVAVCQLKKTYGLACVDHTTGGFEVAEFDSREALDDELARLSPSELLYPSDQAEAYESLSASQSYDAYAFLTDSAKSLLCDHFGVHSLDGFGCGGMDAATSAAGAIVHYLIHQLRRPCDHLRTLRVRESLRNVQVDAASQRNLDLVESRAGRAHTLLGVLDRTCTPMGARLLRDWILHPLREIEPLVARQEVIAAFRAEPFILTKVREALSGIRDIERTTSRLSQGAGNARDMQALAVSLSHIPALKEDLASVVGGGSAAGFVDGYLSRLHDFSALTAEMEAALSDDPPATLKDGGIIADGHSAELDELRDASRDGKKWIAQLQDEERKRTGIESLKVKFNNVFGYFIEISTAKLATANLPDEYTRKQTMANAERFITPALKEMENKVLGAEERSKKLEYELFLALRERVCREIDALQETASTVAEIDVLGGLAEVAQTHQHARPKLEHSRYLEIKNGRHPVLEQTLMDEKFVPNETLFEPDESLVQILTGPNMAGKSTYIRQVALVTLMAQIGACVPAESAVIGIVDRIFCRVGASDDLSRGQSTFMVEMNETALILNHATENSLVILDEIGRGTATFDGLSIAWSVAEFLHDEVRCRTLFATHYHELTDLAETKGSIANFNVAVREWNEEIIFLRKIQAGAADKSYGIQVARLAGLPKVILDRAKDILSHLEMNSARPDAKKRGPKAKNTRSQSMPEANPAQLNLFD